MDNRVFRLGFLFILLLAEAYVYFLGSLLPDLVASHSDVHGEPNGYMVREIFISFMLAVTVGAPLFMALMGGWLQRLLPPSLISVPRRAYWLAPERVSVTHDFLERQALCFALILLAFLCAVDGLLVYANSSEPPYLVPPLMLSLLGLLFVTTFIWIWTGLRYFLRR